MGVAVVQGLKPLSLRLRPFGTLHRLVHGRLPIAGPLLLGRERRPALTESWTKPPGYLEAKAVPE
jgi:hypothetical protein